MSRQKNYERTARRTTTSIAGPRRSGFGHWIPLAITVAVATVGIAAWVWSERQDDDDDEGSDGRRPGSKVDSIYSATPSYGSLKPGETAYGTTVRPEESSSYMARMSGALGRAPSPQQIFDGASRGVVAGVAAAGAVVGNALSSIREEDKNAYKDHKTWSEEVEFREVAGDTRGAPAEPQKSSSTKKTFANPRRKTVAIVVSASTNQDISEDENDYHHEHASILSHLPTKSDFSKIRLFVLVFTPDVKAHLPQPKYSPLAGTLGSSFSNIANDDAVYSEAVDGNSLHQSIQGSPALGALWNQAQNLVEKDTMVLPFTTRTGYIHMLRHLGPDYVYLQEDLAGVNGSNVTQLQSWLRQDVVLVVGVEGGHGGLADSESEAEAAEKSENWWEKEERVGRGRGLVVVEGLRFGEDWARRVQGRD